jgi:GR25 family glycosyltransferase involved in LPS biosynthesis
MIPNIDASAISHHRGRRMDKEVDTIRTLLAKAFERVVCVNLKRRADRWESFLSQMESISYAFGPVIRFNAIDGNRVPAPDWYRVGEASYAWCCLVSHLRIWETALNDGVISLLILEDDAVFCDDFCKRAATFMENVPKDWDQLYFGGHHVPDSIPLRVNEHVYRPEATWRTHAYAIRGEFIKRLYSHVIAFNSEGRFPNPGAYHVDHQLAALMRDPSVHVYCPGQWLVGQRSDFSEVAQAVRHQGVEYYNEINPISKGLFRLP